MNATSLIRWSTVLAVTSIAGVAGWVSYEHALAVVRAHGESGAVAMAYPVTVDGVIYSASMVLLDSARRGVRAPALARWLLALGIGATLLANVTAGVRFGVTGAVVAAWPALALVGSYELLMLMIRREATPAAVTIPTGEAVSGTVASVPGAVPLDVPEGVPVATVSPAPVGTQGTVADVPRAVLPDVPLDTPVTPVSVPQDATEGAPAGVPVSVPHVALVAPVRARGQARRRSPKQSAPERVFAAEIERGELPSLRAIKAGMRCGTDRARVIRGQLAETLKEAPEAA